MKPLCCPEHQESFILGGYICTRYCICCILLSRSQNIMAQPRPQATFLYSRLRRIHWTYRASHLFRINIHLPVPYSYGFVVVMTPQLFRKQYSLSSKIACVFFTLRWVDTAINTTSKKVQDFIRVLFRSYATHSPRHLPEGNLVGIYTYIPINTMLWGI